MTGGPTHRRRFTVTTAWQALLRTVPRAVTSPTDTFTFDIAKLEDNPAGKLTVQTGDCCIHPDFWKAAIDTAMPANAARGRRSGTAREDCRAQ